MLGFVAEFPGKSLQAVIMMKQIPKSASGLSAGNSAFVGTQIDFPSAFESMNGLQSFKAMRGIWRQPVRPTPSWPNNAGSEVDLGGGAQLSRNAPHGSVFPSRAWVGADSGNGIPLVRLARPALFQGSAFSDGGPADPNPVSWSKPTSVSTGTGDRL